MGEKPGEQEMLCNSRKHKLKYETNIWWDPEEIDEGHPESTQLRNTNNRGVAAGFFSDSPCKT